MARSTRPCRSTADVQLRYAARVPLMGKPPFLTANENALSDVPHKGTGIYLFCWRAGGRLVPQYVGYSTRLRQRIREHLERVSMMRALAEGIGRRCVLVWVIEPKRGQCTVRVARQVETSLLRKFREDGFALINERGTRAPVRRVRWDHVSAAVDLIPRVMTL